MANGGVEFDPEQLQRIARDFWNRLRGSRRFIWAAIGIVVALAALIGSYYQVEPDEVGLVTRFGRFVRTTNPGPHGKIPFGIEQVQKVPVQRQLKQEFGFRTVHADVDSTYRKDEKTAAESSMLTGNLNVATVEWIVQYKNLGPLQVPLQAARRGGDLPAHGRGVDAHGRRRSQRDRAPDGGPRGDRRQGQGAALRAVPALRQRDLGAAAGAAGRGSAGVGQAVVQRGEPGHSRARARHQRGLGRVQPGESRAPAASPSRRSRPPKATPSIASTVPRGTPGDSSRCRKSTARRRR